LNVGAPILTKSLQIQRPEGFKAKPAYIKASEESRPNKSNDQCSKKDRSQNCDNNILLTHKSAQIIFSEMKTIVTFLFHSPYQGFYQKDFL
jgi:hypothetical protein